MAWRRTSLFLALALLAGCAAHRTGLRQDEKPDPNVAYLYGRFYVKAEARSSLTSYPTVGLVISCADKRFYEIIFTNKRDDVQVVKVWPSRCGLFQVSQFDERGSRRQRVEVDPASRVFQDFEAGRAYYVGDYFGKAGIDHTYRNDRLKRFRAWDMSPADDRYLSTTADLKRIYPGVGALPKENKRLMRSEPAAKPGAVVIDDPDEPLMTPERIARVATLVKRSYASPAECEAACPTGQCLPFRGEAGPAMACIVRCNADKDCPQGLACNCPNSEKPAGPDCQPIASTPTDKMARICLSVEPAGERR
jgi:hypothetical protein